MPVAMHRSGVYTRDTEEMMRLIAVFGTIPGRAIRKEQLAADVIAPFYSAASNNGDAKELHADLNTMWMWIPKSVANVDAFVADNAVSAVVVSDEACTVQVKNMFLSKVVVLPVQHDAPAVRRYFEMEVQEVPLADMTIKDENTDKAVLIRKIAHHEDVRTQVVVLLDQVTKVTLPLHVVPPEQMESFR